MYVCILDAQGQVLVHQNLRAGPEDFLATIEPYREGLVVAVECIFTWYWLADLCAREGIAFVLEGVAKHLGQFVVAKVLRMPHKITDDLGPAP